MKKIPVIFFVAVMLLPGCALDVPFQHGTEQFSLDMVQNDDSSKSHGEALFDLASEGIAQRRVVGWIDRAT